MNEKYTLNQNEPKKEWPWVIKDRVSIPMTLLLVIIILSTGMALFSLDDTAIEKIATAFVGIKSFSGPWSEGMAASGGPVGIRAMGFFGIIMATYGVVLLVLETPSKSIAEPQVVTFKELALFLFIIGFYLFFNLKIGYSWWDPSAPFYIGETFWALIGFLLFLGIYPVFALKMFKRKNQFLSLAMPPKRWIAIISISLGFGFASMLIHCCRMIGLYDYVYFIAIKFIMIGCTCSFIYGYGLPMLSQFFTNHLTLFPHSVNSGITYLVTSSFFAVLIPWHNLLFTVGFIPMGLVLCEIMRRTGTWTAAFWVYYLSFVFHTGLSWRGDLMTWFFLIPVAMIWTSHVVFHALSAELKRREALT